MASSSRPIAPTLSNWATIRAQSKSGPILRSPAVSNQIWSCAFLSGRFSWQGASPRPRMTGRIYRTHAKEAGSLARFLKGSGRLPPPLPMIGISALVASLEKIALMLRERAKLSPIHRSREDINGSRQYTLFMRLVSLQMQEMFGRVRPRGGRIDEYSLRARNG